jgi:hypothetical protein
MERKTIQFFKQQTTSVSKALWPARAQRCVATSRTAQRRRKATMQGITLRWLWKPLSAQRPRVLYLRALWPDPSAPVQLRAQHLLLALVVGGSIPLLCSLYSWSVLPVLGILSALLTLVVTQQIIANRQQHRATTKTPPARPALTTLPVRSLPIIPATEQTVCTIPPAAPLLSFPNTPMPVPATPLVRVLETIDLSSSNVEHFLDIPDTSTGILSKGESQQIQNLSMQE